MALIQDIGPPPSDKRKRDQGLQAAVQTVRRVHQATQLSNLQLPQRRAQRPVRSMDMLAPPKPAPKPVSRQPLPARPLPSPSSKVLPPRSGLQSQPPKLASKPVAKRRGWQLASEFAQYPLIAALAIACAYNSTIGQAAIGLYFVIAMVFRLGSRFSFAAALLLLVSIPGFQALNLTGVSQKAAVYAFELLVVGTLQAIIELVIDNRKQPI